MPTLDTPGQVAAAIPVMLGFHPQNSAVLILTVDDTIALTMRIDLPDATAVETDSDYAQTWLAPVTSTIARTFDHPEAFVVFYPTGTLDPTTAGGLLSALDAIGTGVRESLMVTGDRWHCLTCGTGTPARGCCPETGTTITEADRAHVRALLGDAPVAASREALAEEIAPAHEEARARVAALIADLPQVDEDNRDAHIQAFHDALSATELDDATSARLLAGLADTRVRDTVLWDIVHSDAPAQQQACALLRALTRLAPDAHLAPPATLLAACTWMRGDGARALLALDRAADGDPQYTLSELVSGLITSGMPPSTWVDGVHSLTREACRGALVS